MIYWSQRDSCVFLINMRKIHWCINIKWNLLHCKWVRFSLNFDVNSKLRKINCWRPIVTLSTSSVHVCVCVQSCVCACVLFDENRQTELTNCPREQILRVGVWIQIIVLAGSERAVFTRDWSHGGNGGRCVCPHTPSSRAEQHIGKLIMSKSGIGTNLLPHAIRKGGL